MKINYQDIQTKEPRNYSRLFGYIGFFDDSYRFGFNGMEKDNEIYGEGNSYTAEFWQYDPRTARRWNVDPLTFKFPFQSPYCTFDGNPILLIDPTGMGTESTIVTKNEDGTYKVIGGDPNDGDNNIYLVGNDYKLEDNNYKTTGTVVGTSLTPQSFYYSEKNEWHGTIDPNDHSGENYLNNEIIGARFLTLAEYMPNAVGGKTHDFKRRGTTQGDANYDNPEYHYRGMPVNGVDLSSTDANPYNIGVQVKGNLTVYASARDIGNAAAGYMAGVSGFTWGQSRVALDGLESYQNGAWSTEGSSTQLAQKVGFQVGQAENQARTRQRMKDHTK